MVAARDLNSARNEKNRLDRLVRDIESQIQRFDELQELNPYDSTQLVLHNRI